MRRKMTAVWRWFLCLSLFAPAVLRGQDLLVEGPNESESAESEDDVTQEIGAFVGASVGMGTGPGGFSVAGRYLYRFTDVDWLESGALFSFGAQGASCFRDRQDELLCPRGVMDGFSGGVSAGMRRYFSGQGDFRPFLRGGLGVHLLSFSGDDVKGLGFPLYAGGGVRAKVSTNVQVVGEATVHLGPSFLNRGLGTEFDASLAVISGVEFTLD